MGTIAVISALHEEILPLVDDARETTTVINDEYFHFYRGRVDSYEHDIIFGATGVGKALASLNTQRIVDQFHPEHIFLIGSCGGATIGVNPGDIIIPTATAQSDYDLTCAGHDVSAVKLPLQVMPSRIDTNHNVVHALCGVEALLHSIEGRSPVSSPVKGTVLK